MKTNSKINFSLPALFTGLAMSALLLGCSGKEASKSFGPDGALKLISGDLFSDRPTNLTNVAILIKLKTPSLIESSSTNESGELVLDETTKQLIIAEQDETLKKVKEISPDIKLLFSYKFTVNALALSVPAELYDQVGNLGTVAEISPETTFKRPEIPAMNEVILKELVETAKQFKTTSVSHIGATRANDELGVRGKGIKVGVIDTGIDYTHLMLGGTGNAADYENMDKEKETPHFPNKKVVGGFDFAGTDYSPGAVFPDWRVPRPDVNPIDEGGHGTHVAGSVAGLGDGVNTYDGVAPDADLYALKVFGNNGGTSDTVVIAAMEWAMDPNGDLDPSDRLDVLNLSLGGNFGKPYILYSLAVKNLARAGVITTISAGNSGPTPFIVGAPGTSNEAISVAASVDGMDKNWKFDAVAFSAKDVEEFYAQRVEAAFTPSVVDKPVTGKLVYIGEAATDLSDEVKKILKGNIALIDRGSVAFVDKVKRAEEAGAIGAVVANNKPGDAFVMGGEGEAGIPAVMITLDQGTSIKAIMESKDVIANLATEKLIEKPEIVDTLTGFSSQGPRSEDGLLKPEIAAPGYQIISASMGSGTKGVALNGTSMSAPHMAGVMALVKEKFKTLTNEEAKAVVMNTAKLMKDEKGQNYSVTLQGAGLVDVHAALTADIRVLPASLSLGQFQLEKTKIVKRTILVKNFGPTDKTYQLSFSGAKNIEVESKVFEVKANSETEVSFKVRLIATPDQALEFHEGFISISEGPHKKASLPVLGVSKRLSRIVGKELSVFSSGPEDSFDALTELKLENNSQNAGIVEIFNLLGVDQRKPTGGRDASILSRQCDLQAVGYRMVERGEKKHLQLGIKIFNAVSNWQACEMSVLIDQNKDKEPEQEIGGLPHNYLSGLSDLVPAGFYSVLLDFPKAVSLRQAYEQAAQQNNGNAGFDLTYREAMQDIQPMETYANSHITIMEIDPEKLLLTDDGRINLKVTVFSEGGVEYEDGLQERWFTISPREEEQAFRSIPEKVELKAGETKTLDLVKGHGIETLMLVTPFNYQVDQTQTTVGKGLQILRPIF